MKTLPLLALVGISLGSTLSLAAEDPAAQLAGKVMSAVGAEQWAQVKEIKFTFNVDAGGKTVLSAAHDWNLATGKDTVSWAGKTVTVDLANPGSSADEKAAFARWTNDSYWLLMPLKLKDRGTNVAAMPPQEIEGKKFKVLQLSFGKIGMTPKDHYNLYIDPKTDLVAQWDYMPEPSKKVHGTWEDYRDFSGIKLSTGHQFGDKRIYFTGVAVTKY
jgi:hypothetical protein